MTDIADLQRKANAAREFQVVVGACTYTLRLPTEHERRMSALRARGPGEEPDAAFTEVMIRALLEAAVVRWHGVTCEMLATGGGPEAAELVPGAAGLLLDNQAAAARALTLAFVERLALWRQQVEELEKN